MPETAFSTSSRRTKFFVSLSIYYSNFIMCVGSTFLSPLILEFTKIFNTTVDQVSRLFTIMLICYLASALFGMVIYKYVNRQLVVPILLSLIASSYFLVPSATALPEFFAYISLLGLGGGAYDTAQVAWIIDIWRDEASPWILAQYFANSLGTLVSPLILSIFLSNDNAADIRTPYYIVGSMIAVAVVIHTIIYFSFRNGPPPVVASKTQMPILVKPSLEPESINSISSPSGVSTALVVPQERDSSYRKYYIIALCCCVIGFYSALELCTQQFLPTYVHFSPMKLSPAEATKVLFGLQLGYFTGRLVGILLIVKIQPQFILIGNLILLSVSNTILYIWGGSSMAMLWVGSIMVGVGMSTVSPSVYAYIKNYLAITETISGILLISGSCMSAIYPLIVGKLIEKTPDILIYANYTSLGISVIAFSLLFSMTYVRTGLGNTKP